MVNNIPEQTKLLVDGLSIGVIVSALNTWLPPLSALAALIWSLIRIYETQTIQNLLAKLRKTKET